MKKTIALSLAAVMLLSGCSSKTEESATLTSSQSSNTAFTNEPINSIPQTISKEKEEQFNQKCQKVIEAFVSSFKSVSPNVDVKYREPTVNYKSGNNYLTKLFSVKSGNNENERGLICFLDIFTDDEYEFFQTMRDVISFLEKNALDICGQNRFVIYINSQENGGGDIGIVFEENNASVSYANRNIRSAYSDRLKSIDILKDCDESLSLKGLIKFDDVSKLYEPYDVSCEYNGKTLTHKWYKIDEDENKPIFVTYIDDGTYNDMSDEELIYYAYNSVYNENNKVKFNEDGVYHFAYKSDEHDYPMACTIYYYSSEYFKEHSLMKWYGDYDRLNSNPLNEKLNAELKSK